MRNVLIGGLLALTACGLDEEKFSEDFVEMYCTAYDECDTSGRECSVNLDNESGNCAFDKAAAKDCLAEDFGCDDTIPGFEVVTTPEACLLVCGQDTTEE